MREPWKAFAVDLPGYLQRTSHIDVEASERLRFLAIQLERTWGYQNHAMTDRVYVAGIAMDPTSPVLWHSRGIYAKVSAIVAERSARRRRLSKLARRYFQHALELDSQDPRLLYSLGKWHYEFGETADAATFFDRAIALDPNHGWALLYRAHCLHDQEKWSAAAEAYAAVPLETFKGPPNWRVDTLRDQRAYCVMRAGRRREALGLFSELLARFEREPARAARSTLPHLSSVATGVFEDALGERFRSVPGLLDAWPLEGGATEGGTAY